MTEVIRSLRQMSQWSNQMKEKDKTIGFVPTMGYLHEGHLSLMRRAKREAEKVVVSLFVNPAQFGPREDFKRYPRSFRKDLALVKKENVDLLFAPNASDIFPIGYETVVETKRLSKILEGKSRLNHFQGVTTVVCKLFHIVQPNIAYFGQKDYQQAVIIKRMVKDLNFNIKIRILPTIRDANGLALSSRNTYLSPWGRRSAPVLFCALQQGRDMIRSGTMDSVLVLAAMKKKIQQSQLVKLDYLAIVDTETLKPLKKIDKRILLVGAIWIGKTRLIDNLIVSP